EIHGLKFYHDVLQGSLQAVGPTRPRLFRGYGVVKSLKRARTDEPGHQHESNNGSEEGLEELMNQRRTWWTTKQSLGLDRVGMCCVECIFFCIIVC
ncbi:hypothetical protein JG688_00014290, partial [Phytophthora aleatoria]